MNIAYVYWRGQEQGKGKCGQQASGAPARFFLNPSCLLSFPSHSHPLRNWIPKHWSPLEFWWEDGLLSSGVVSHCRFWAAISPLSYLIRSSSSLFLLEIFANLSSTDSSHILSVGLRILSIGDLFFVCHWCVTGGKRDKDLCSVCLLESQIWCRILFLF